MPAAHLPLHLLPRCADHGFDPLGLGSSPEQLSWNVHAEIFHGRLAMTGVAGILLTSVRAAAAAGSEPPQAAYWWGWQGNFC